jgi:hypothetical protein
MDIDNIFKFATETFSDYFTGLGQTILGQPFFQPVAAPSATGHSGIRSEPRRSDRLQPALFGFVVLSIFFGIALEAVRNKEMNKEDLAPIVVFLIISWLVYGSFTYGVCRLLRGSGSFLATISMMLQLLSTVFVISSFGSLCLFAASTAIVKFAHFHSSLLDQLIQPGFGFYYIIHVILLLIYVPLLMRRIHGFGVVKTIVLFFIPLFAALCGMLIAVLHLVLTVGS